MTFSCDDVNRYLKLIVLVKYIRIHAVNNTCGSPTTLVTPLHALIIYVCSISDELVDWDPWQPAAAVIDREDGNGPHCDDPDFNVRWITNNYCN